MLIKTLKKKSGGILSTDSILQKEIITLRKEIIYTQTIKREKTGYRDICNVHIM